MIKQNTAFYGAVSIIRERSNIANMPKASDLHKNMVGIQKTYRLYTTQEYRKKVMTGLGAWTIINKQAVFAVVLKYCKTRGINPQEMVLGMVRGFNGDADFLGKFRIRPCVSLMAMIHYRTKNFTKADFAKRNTNYHKMNRAMTENGYFVPGWAKVEDRSFWLFPFPVSNQKQFTDFCNANGVFCIVKST